MYRSLIHFIFVAFISSLCVFVSDTKVQPYKPASNCATLECPSYTIVYSNKNFEIRSYKSAQWISSPAVVSDTYTTGSNEGFMTLFNYIGGNNKPQVRISMTAPVLVDIRNSTYTSYFYVPQKYQNGIPTPLTDKIKPVTFPKQKYAAVRRFDGYLSGDRNPKELAALKKSLKDTPYQRAADERSYTVAGYNSPFELFNRVNEAMLWFH